MKTSDSPDQIEVTCSPIDFEAARAQLEQHGYVLVKCETLTGKLRLTGNRKQCTCDLCRMEGEP